MKTLRDLKPGENGTVSMIKIKGLMKKRLMDMGVIKGCDIYVEKIAPLGDPIEIKIRGYNLSLRKEDAGNIILD